ncbi:MAG: hypothetical protein JW902_17645 [Syntrophaceae bacterium]|nr:hypothetical protein [Syntrophaceae bacterium]
MRQREGDFILIQAPGQLTLHPIGKRVIRYGVALLADQDNRRCRNYRQGKAWQGHQHYGQLGYYSYCPYFFNKNSRARLITEIRDPARLVVVNLQGRKRGAFGGC